MAKRRSADPHGAHAVLEVFAEADAGVETGFDDIGETLVRHHFQGDAGIVAGQFAETWREDETDGVSRCVDSYQAVRRFAKAVKAVQRGGDVFERRVRCASRCSPASVGETLRVVRLNRRIPTWVSSSRRVWLSVGGVTPRVAAARRKLRSRAMATKAARPARSGFFIGLLK